MIRRLAFIIVIAFTTSVAHSQSIAKEIISHGISFKLNRQLVVVSDKWETRTADEVVAILDQSGFHAKRVKKAKPSLQGRISVERVRAIEKISDPDALQIKVTSNRITIRYTNEASRQKALKYFKGLISGSEIMGYDIRDWSGVGLDVNKSAKDKKGFVVASESMISLTDLESIIQQNKANEVMVQFVDADHWRLESSVFELANPNASPFPSSGYYRFNMVAEIINKMHRQRITVIPVIDLLSPNKPFEKVTGHTLYSVEGMRFVRAILEEYAEKLKCKKICIGSINPNVEKRYVEFLNDIAARCGIELVIR